MEWLDSVCFPLSTHLHNYAGTVFLHIFYNRLSLLLVIGRGGEQISRLQQESGCKIQIAPGKCCHWAFLIPTHHSFATCLMDHLNLCHRQRRIARQVGHINGAT